MAARAQSHARAECGRGWRGRGWRGRGWRGRGSASCLGDGSIAVGVPVALDGLKEGRLVRILLGLHLEGLAQTHLELLLAAQLRLLLPRLPKALLSLLRKLRRARWLGLGVGAALAVLGPAAAPGHPRRPCVSYLPARTAWLDDSHVDRELRLSGQPRLGLRHGPALVRLWRRRRGATASSSAPSCGGGHQRACGHRLVVTQPLQSHHCAPRISVGFGSGETWIASRREEHVGDGAPAKLVRHRRRGRLPRRRQLYRWRPG